MKNKKVFGLVLLALIVFVIPLALIVPHFPIQGVEGFFVQNLRRNLDYIIT